MDGPSPPAAIPEYLDVSIRRALRPLIRFFLSRGIGLPFLIERLKAIYVEVAEDDFPIEGRKQTDSRISLLTGVHRKDVRRLRDANPVASENVSKSVLLGMRLVGYWAGSSEYSDDNGEPLPLARLASKGGKKSFEALVQSVSTDIRSRAMLDELLRLGVVRRDNEDRIHLEKAAFIPEKGIEQKAYFFGHNLHDHIAAAAHNLNGIAPAFLERSVSYNELSETSVTEVRRLTEVHAMKALLAINKKALELEKKDARSKGLRFRFDFGAYFYSEPTLPASKGR